MKCMYSEPYKRNRLILKKNILITLFFLNNEVPSFWTAILERRTLPRGCSIKWGLVFLWWLMGETKWRIRTEKVHWKAFHCQWLPSLQICVRAWETVTLSLCFPASKELERTYQNHCRQISKLRFFIEIFRNFGNDIHQKYELLLTDIPNGLSLKWNLDFKKMVYTFVKLPGLTYQMKLCLYYT